MFHGAKGLTWHVVLSYCPKGLTWSHEQKSQKLTGCLEAVVIACGLCWTPSWVERGPWEGLEGGRPVGRSCFPASSGAIGYRAIV